MKIFTYAYNKPKYLYYQNKCLKKFITEPFEFNCIDNSKEFTITQELKSVCQSEGINYIRNLKPDHTLEGTSHYAAMQWSYNTLISHNNEISVMIDHDNFPINYINITNLLGDHQLAGVSQSRGHVEYFNPALMIFNVNTMPNKHSLSFKGSLIEGQAADVGGELYYYFRDNPSAKRKNLQSGPILADDPILSDLGIKYGYPHTFDLIEGSFVHPRNGSNWARVPKQEFENRDKLIFELLERNLLK